MTRDYVNYRKKRQKQSSKLSLFAIVITLGVFAASGAWYFNHQRTLDVANLKEEAVTKVSSFFPSIFQKHKSISAKKIIAVVEAEKPLHFDFYDELPKTRLEVTQASEDKEEVGREVAFAEPRQPVVESAQAQKPVVAVKTTEPEKGAVENVPYILQVAVFHNIEAANRYRNALASAGLKIDVVRAREGNDIVYRLQQGPYRNMDQLKVAKKKLMDRGITCDVRRATPYT